MAVNSQKQDGAAWVKISTVSGRLVKNLFFNLAGDGTHSFVWDKTDSKGKLVKEGIYLATLTVIGKPASQKFTLK